MDDPTEDGTARIIKTLQEERLRRLQYRTDYNRRKLVFIGSLLTIGALDFPVEGVPDLPGKIGFVYVIYIVPVISLIFDFYIQSEDFCIKRINGFILEKIESFEQEAEWVKWIGDKRDNIGTIIVPAVTVLVIIACTLVLDLQEEISWTWGIWAVVNTILVVVLTRYSHSQRQKLMRGPNDDGGKNDKSWWKWRIFRRKNIS